MSDKPAETARTRVLASIQRYSRGQSSRFVIGPDGRPKHQVDCARELGLPPRRVSKAVRALKRRGYLEDRPKLLVPAVLHQEMRP